MCRCLYTCPHGLIDVALVEQSGLLSALSVLSLSQGGPAFLHYSTGSSTTFVHRQAGAMMLLQPRTGKTHVRLRMSRP